MYQSDFANNFINLKHWSYRLHVCVPPDSCVEILPLKEVVLGGGTFGRRLGHKDGALMHGIGAS